MDVEYENPWKWDMDDLIKNVRVQGEDIYHDDEDDVPMLKVMRIVMQIYMGALAKNKEEIELNLQNMEEAKHLLFSKDLEGQGISKEVLNHITDSTKYHALKELDLDDEAEIFKRRINTFTNLSNMEKSTFDGLKCIAFSQFFDLGCSRAIPLAENAIKNNSECAVWHYLLAWNLRRDRRHICCYAQRPDPKEKNAFAKAYELSENPTFGIRLAQCHRELKNFQECTKLYYDILAKNPKSSMVQLRLALGFMTLKDFPAASRCLKYVEDLQRKDAMFIHYKGLYLMRTNQNLDEAARLLKEAGDAGNLPAAMEYVECCEKISWRNNSIEYLKGLEEKENSREMQQQLCLHIAMYFYLKLKDLEGALEYFEKAIDIDPENILLQRYTWTFQVSKNIQQKNIYNILNVEFLPLVGRKLGNLSRESKKIYEKLQSTCKQRSSARDYPKSKQNCGSNFFKQ